MRRFAVAGFALGIVALAAVALAAEKAAEKAAGKAAEKAAEKTAGDPTGTWKWTMPGRGGGPGREATLKLKLEKDKLTGVTIGRNDEEISIEDAKYTAKDGEISYSVTREFGGNKFTIKYKGKLSGDTIKGKIEMPGRDGGDPMSMDWEAKRAAAADNPTGTWTWKQPGRGGEDVETTLTLKLEGDKLTGSTPGRGDTPIEITDGKYKAGEISFSIVREGRAGKRISKYTGKLSGDTIKGKMELPGRGGAEATSSDWEAKRAKAAEAKK
jgi:hypothetical protein